MAKIQGFIVDAQDKRLPKVTVSFHDTNGNDADEVLTNAEGFYITKALKTGNYEWKASLQGFSTASGLIQGVKGGTQAHKLPPFVLERVGGGINGRVVDPADKAVEAVKILARSKIEKIGPVLSNADGAFQFSDLAAGKYELTAEPPPGFQSPKAQSVKVDPGKITDKIIFRLVPIPVVAVGSISGKVTKASGAAIEGVDVTATNQANPAVTGTTATNAAGNYKIDPLPQGIYMMQARAPSGFLEAAPIADIAVAPGKETTDVDVVLLRSSISGKVVGLAAGILTKVAALDPANHVVGTPAETNVAGNYNITDLPTGVYTVSVQDHPEYISAFNVEVFDTEITGIDFMLNPVDDFLGRLDDTRFSIESRINEDEVVQAISLFSVANTMLAGLGTFRKGEMETIDVLGISTLFYGLQDGSLRQKIVVKNPVLFWRQIEGDLKSLSQKLNDYQSDVQFLLQEARRQFALGWNSSTNGGVNYQFPQFLKRYIEIANQPLLSLNIREQEKDPLVDPVRISEFYGLLRDLKSIILQIIRSLSKYGTAATKRSNEDWSEFETKANEILATIAQFRIMPDQGRRNHWSVLADLTNKNRETEIVPHIVLARQGGRLLQFAKSIYQSDREIDRFDDAHLRDIFQPGVDAANFWTERIRGEAAVLKQYPLRSWV